MVLDFEPIFDCNFKSKQKQTKIFVKMKEETVESWWFDEKSEKSQTFLSNLGSCGISQNKFQSFELDPQ